MGMTSGAETVTGSARRFDKLLAPIAIGNLKLRNRIVMPGMWTGFAHDDGSVSDVLVDYLEARAKGGVGLVICELTLVEHPRGMAVSPQLRIDDDLYLPGLSRLAAAIQRHGAKAAVQLHHGGRKASQHYTGVQPVSASATPILHHKEVPREATTAEIAELVECYANAAARAAKAGFDAVELHAGHEYLIAQFLSPAVNKRQDAYGGATQNRARFLSEIVSAIRQTLGPDFPVSCRIDGSEFGIPGGITLQDACETASLAAQAGSSAIHVTAWAVGNDCWRGAQVMVKGSLLDLAATVKPAVSVPVIAVGRISPELAETAIRDGRVDLVAMGRALIADPELPNKLAEGKREDVRPCITCGQCNGREARGLHLQCAVNFATGREREAVLQPAEKVKKVLVVGAGPAGVEAATTAASRGHRVTICDEYRRVGGSLVLASVFNEDLEPLVAHFETKLRKLGIVTRLGVNATPELVSQLKPDAVIVATGGRPIAPKIPGIDGKNVVGLRDMQTLFGTRPETGSRGIPLWWNFGSVLLRFGLRPRALRSLLRSRFVLGKRVVIVGGTLPGIELGATLAEAGKKITIVESSPKVGESLSPVVFRYLRYKLMEHGAQILAHTRCELIKPEGVVVAREDGQTELIEADTVCVALGNETDLERAELLRRPGVDLYTCGDCVRPGVVLEAVHGGAVVGRAV